MITNPNSTPTPQPAAPAAIKYVAYYRVSTEQQEESNLGMVAQRSIVANFVKCTNCIIAEFEERESGKKSDRPKLRAALTLAKDNNAVLIVAKLDRLSRNVLFLAQLMESRVAFKCCDLPECDNFTIHLFAALAQKEAEMISSRTKAALAVLIAKRAIDGEKMGNRLPFDLSIQKKGTAALTAKAKANENNRRAATLTATMRANGAKWTQIVNTLNAGGFKTSRGKLFAVTQVQRLLKYQD